MKICSKCGVEKDKSEFYKNRTMKDGLSCWCKHCEKSNRKINEDKIKRNNKRYYKENIGKFLEKSKLYRKNNSEKVAKAQKVYYVENKEKILKQRKEYRDNNKDKIKERNKLYKNSKAKYKTYYNKLTVDEKPKLHSDGKSLSVVCRYCGKRFIPDNKEVRSRIKALKYGDGYELSLYCSDNCKKACPVYDQKKYPKGFKKASSREVDPLVRQLCFERDSWECQKCGATQKELQLHVHHIKSYTQNKILGNDVDNCITLCKNCHKETHSKEGCNYYELRCKN